MLHEEHLTQDRPTTRWGRLYEYLFAATSDRIDMTRSVGEALRAPYLR